MEGDLECRECNDGHLVPLSDYAAGGAAVHYKAWVCVNPSCGFNLKIRNGEIFRNEPIQEGESRGQQVSSRGQADGRGDSGRGNNRRG